MPVDSLIQPFRRNIAVAPVVGTIGLDPIPKAVPPMIGAGVTSFILTNPNPFFIWFTGWRGSADDMPNIKENGHYLHPYEKYLGRTQMPQWVAACPDDEPGYPITDSEGNWLFANRRTRFVLIYGSGQ